MDTAQIERLETNKKRSLSVLYLSIIALVVSLAFRFVPRLNDALSGPPQYVHILTESIARQLAAQSHFQFPVIVKHDEDGSCEALKGPKVPDEDIQGTLYILTYSEHQHSSCITSYVVPAQPARYSNVITITAHEGRNFGPALLSWVKAVPFDRSVHAYSPEYLNTLHWRYTPHFPLTASEAAKLASRSYYSGQSEPDASANIEFNYADIRTTIAGPHEKLNFRLYLVLLGWMILLLSAVGRLFVLYSQSAQYCRVYHQKLTLRAFLKENIAAKIAAARQQYFEQQELEQEKMREEERLRLVRMGWKENLRSALPKITDEPLRMKVQGFLETASPDLDQMEALWIEIQERGEQKTPTEKLAILVESVRPYCTEEEFQACWASAFAILMESGFRPARKFAITMHDQFKMRAREMEEMEKMERRDENIA